MKKYLVIILSAAAYGIISISPALAAFSLNTVNATSSDNIILTATNGGDGYLFKIPDTTPAGWGIIGGAFGGSVNTYGVTIAYSPTVGQNLGYMYGTSHNLKLGDGTYVWFDASPISGCSGGATYETCQALYPSNFIVFQICAAGLTACNVAPTSTVLIASPVDVFNTVAYDVVYTILGLIILGIFVALLRGW